MSCTTPAESRCETAGRPIKPGVTLGDLEFARAGLAADEGEAQEVEGFRLAEPAPPAAFRRKTSELDQPGLLGMQ